MTKCLEYDDSRVPATKVLQDKATTENDHSSLILAACFSFILQEVFVVM